jgi:hypothetical protein
MRKQMAAFWIAAFLGVSYAENKGGSAHFKTGNSRIGARGSVGARLSNSAYGSSADVTGSAAVTILGA